MRAACRYTLALALACSALPALAQTPGNLVVSGQVQQATCVAHSDSIDLPDVRADLLGTAAASTDFNVRMTCPMAGIELVLTLRDAGDPDFNTGFHLARSAGSTAKGVAIGLLRNSQAVAFTTPWVQGRSVVGENLIGLTAMYVRTREPEVVPGSIGGTALLQAAYR